MKGFRFGAALLLLALPVVVIAQSVTQDGQSTRGVQQGVMVQGLVRADSTGQCLTMDGSGNLKMVDGNPARLDFRDGSVAIINSAIANGSADSSAVINVGKYRLQGLAVRIVGSPATTIRLAIQIRFHLNSQSDSTSIFPWLPHGNVGTGASVDSLAFSSVIAPTAILQGRSEFTLTLSQDAPVASKFGNGAAAYINLHDWLGHEFWAPYISVRIRVIAVSTTITAATVQAYLTGTPL